MESDKTRIVWITLLALADKNGEVQGSIPGIARLAGVSVEDCRKAFDCLLGPDTDSRTKTLDGRRVVAIDGGWELVNHSKYRALASKEESIASNAERQRRFRARNGIVTQSNALVTDHNAPVTQSRDIAEAEAEAEEKTKTVGPNGKAVVPETTKSRVKFTDPEWLQSLKSDPTYAHVDIDFEHGKMARWCEQKKKQQTRLRFLNWIGRIEKPLNGGHSALMR
jgi:hypothetical protein